jgi:hypothetical protein
MSILRLRSEFGCINYGLRRSGSLGRLPGSRTRYIQTKFQHQIFIYPIASFPNLSNQSDALGQSQSARTKVEHREAVGTTDWRNCSHHSEIWGICGGVVDRASNIRRLGAVTQNPTYGSGLWASRLFGGSGSRCARHVGTLEIDLTQIHAGQNCPIQEKPSQVCPTQIGIG